jgi:Domain of unknown function (DUF3291)
MFLAQLNIATLEEPLESPRFAGFREALDRTNALAESSAGFVWRLVGDGKDASGYSPFGDQVLVNLSVWENVDFLFDFVYKTAHADVMGQRKQWFPKMTEAHMVLWWIQPGHMPPLTEAAERLSLLREQGPTPAAFTFKQRFASCAVVE